MNHNDNDNIVTIGGRDYFRDDDGSLRRVDKYKKKLEEQMDSYKEKIQKVALNKIKKS